MSNETKLMILYVSVIVIPIALYLISIVREKIYEWLEDDDTGKDK